MSGIIQNNILIDLNNTHNFIPIANKATNLIDISTKCPDAISSTIFSHFSYTTQSGVFCIVSKAWRKLAENPHLSRESIYRDIAMNSQRWTNWYNADLPKEDRIEREEHNTELSSLPMNIGQTLKSSCLIFPGNRVIQTHILVRLSRGFTTNLLLKKYSETWESSCPRIKKEVAEECGNTQVDQPTWFIMTTGCLPASNDITYIAQKALVSRLVPYEVPPMLAALTCKIGLELLNKSKWDPAWSWNAKRFRFSSLSYFTFVKENFRGSQLVMGDFFHIRNFEVHCQREEESSINFGMALLLKLS